MTHQLRLKHFPISFFAPVLGFAGFSLALLKTESLVPFLPHTVSLGFIGFTILLYITMLVFYGFKLIMFRQDVIEEYHHPIKINFFPLIAKVPLVLSVAFLQLNMSVSKGLWIAGVVLTLIFGFSIINAWVTHKHFKIHHLSPAWFIPVVGNIIVPIAGVQHAHPEISWFFFTIGTIWMIMLTTIIFYRLIFHDPLPDKLLPTLFILFAAPAIGFIAYNKLTGEFDVFARILYYSALFLFFFIFMQGKNFIKINFFLSWWAYTFPLAAFVLASILMSHVTHYIIFKVIALAALVVLILIIAILLIKTFKAIGRKEICIEE